MASDRMDFVRSYLTKKPGAEFADVKAAGAKKGHQIPPVVFGKAKQLLGLTKPSKKKKAGKKKATRKKAGRKKATSRATSTRSISIGRKRGPGRPRKAVSPTDTLDSLVESMRMLENERDQYKAALDQIAAILNDI